MIRIENLSVTYRSSGAVHHAVRGVSLAIQQGKFYTLLGPSGCGKTTTLRTVAGLERPDSGRVIVDDVVVNDPAAGIFVEPNDRNIGMVFQSYAIWPHMTVFDNVAFPLRQLRPKPNASAIRKRALEALSLVKLDHLEQRPAPFLSGGQQQRLALARALVFEPRVLLLDEPLSNLDAKLRDDMRGEIADLVRRLHITTLFVTHEQIEALTMSDQIGLMRDGIIIQEGTPTEIYQAPWDRFAAEFVGKMNVIPGPIGAVDKSSETYQVDTTLGNLEVGGRAPEKSGTAVSLVIRPESLRIANEGDGQPNKIRCILSRAVFLGNIAECIFVCGETELRVQVHPRNTPDVGSMVTLEVSPRDIRAVTS